MTYDYWMFGGLRDSGNPVLHVTSTGCDDGVAVSLCAGSLSALALHGFLPRPPDMPADAQVVLVGGGNTILQGYLLEGLGNAGFDARDAGQHGELNGDAACNIVNRTLLGMGAQLELSKPLREAMFTEHSRSRRKHTTTQLFWTFVAACRDALDRLEAQQIVTRPNLRCLGNGAEFVLTPYRPRCHLPAETARWSTITQIYEGTNKIQRMVMARQLLK